MCGLPVRGGLFCLFLLSVICLAREIDIWDNGYGCPGDG